VNEINSLNEGRFYHGQPDSTVSTWDFPDATEIRRFRIHWVSINNRRICYSSDHKIKIF
jgi:hypothetical protein